MVGLTYRLCFRKNDPNISGLEMWVLDPLTARLSPAKREVFFSGVLEFSPILKIGMTGRLWGKSGASISAIDYTWGGFVWLKCQILSISGFLGSHLFGLFGFCYGISCFKGRRGWKGGASLIFGTRLSGWKLATIVSKLGSNSPI